MGVLWTRKDEILGGINIQINIQEACQLRYSSDPLCLGSCLSMHLENWSVMMEMAHFFQIVHKKLFFFYASSKRPQMVTEVGKNAYPASRLLIWEGHFFLVNKEDFTRTNFLVYHCTLKRQRRKDHQNTFYETVHDQWTEREHWSWPQSDSFLGRMVLSVGEDDILEEGWGEWNSGITHWGGGGRHVPNKGLVGTQNKFYSEHNLGELQLKSILKRKFATSYNITHSEWKKSTLQKGRGLAWRKEQVVTSCVDVLRGREAQSVLFWSRILSFRVHCTAGVGLIL